MRACYSYLAIRLWMAVLCSFSLVKADQAITVQTVSIGDSGNAADANGYGAVSHEFRIGKYDITQSQYAAFLNAVAATDTYGLYDTRMAQDQNVAGISRSGPNGSYTYSVIGSGNQPIGYVSWFNAARFANWLHNRQPTGVQVAATTEQGAYALNGVTSGIILKNAGAQYWIPSGDEWCKAAYYDKSLNSGAGGYWLYPTRSNIAPGNVIGSGLNQANIYINGKGYAVTQSTVYSNSQNYLTAVGAYSASGSYYGTFDQAGNVLEWNDDVISGAKRGLRGGSWPGGASFLLSSYNPGYDPANYHQDYGFRIAAAAIPDSDSPALPLVGVVILAVLLFLAAGLYPKKTTENRVGAEGRCMGE